MSFEIQTQNNLIEHHLPQAQPQAQTSSLHMQKLQDRMNQLEKAILSLGKKESYVAAMAVDLEHIMMVLIKRLDREGSPSYNMAS